MGNTAVLGETALVEAFNLKAAIDFQARRRWLRKGGGEMHSDIDCCGLDSDAGAPHDTC